MALSRFENDINLGKYYFSINYISVCFSIFILIVCILIASQMPGGAANNLVAGNPGLGPLAKRLMMDPDIDEKEALSLIQLAPETLYLIDKVVRQKARYGPIGIDNSELINLEMENEFKNRNKHIFKLNNGEIDD